MIFSIKQFFVQLLFNGSLLFMLIIGIQNSHNKSKVNLGIDETIKLPISFIIGISFISGSLTANLLSKTKVKEK
tara:strand:- start:273 stop:494 length:222 start_codon:yes stop_codon:yes gene_type:complete